MFIATTFLVPSLVLRREGSLLGRIARGGLNTSAFWVAAALCLSSLKCMNALTLILLGGLLLLLASNRSAALPLRRRIELLPDRVLSSFRNLDDVSVWLERYLATWRSLRSHPWTLRITQMLARLPSSSFAFLILVCIVIAMTMSMRLAGLHTARLSHPDEYLALLRTRELMLSQHVLGRPFLLPAMAAITAYLSSVDPLAVVQGLSVLVPILLALALGRTVFLLTGSLVASATAMYCQGVVSLAHAVASAAAVLLGADNPLAQWMSAAPASSLESQACLLCFLLWIAVVLEARWYDAARELTVATLACLLVVATSSVLLLVVLPFVGAACLSRRPAVLLAIEVGALTAAGLVWVARSPTAPADLQFLPCALSLLAGLTIYCMEVALVTLIGLPARVLVACASVCAAALWLTPRAEPEDPLEYDSVAQNAMAIVEQFPHQRWIIAAPVEQLPEVYSLGYFQDLAALVNDARGDDLSKALRYGKSYDDLFIFVEKSPFSRFPLEPGAVDFSVLTDSTYRYYRSPAGRASLEARAMHLCEVYRATHTGMSVYFEDQSIRIYRIRLAALKH